MSLLLGIDIGTTATKAIVLDPVDGVLAQAERPVPLHSDHPGWAEEDVDEWWTNVAALCRELASGREIAAVGVSGMVPCVVLQDEDGTPLRHSIQQNDARATAEISELAEQLAGARVLERTGLAITQQSVAPTVRWLQRTEPEAWLRTRTIAGSYDTIVRQLTGERSVEMNWALESGLYDLETSDWAADILAMVDLDPALLPPVRRPDEIVGQVRPLAAEATGLPVGTPVVAGSADHVASAFAAGLVRQGDLQTQVTADVLGVPLETLTAHAGSAVGAAFAAGVGVGAFPDWDAIERFVRVGEVIHPRDHEAYEGPYWIFRALYPALREVAPG